MMYFIKTDSPKFYHQRNQDEKTRAVIKIIYKADFDWEVDDIHDYMKRSFCTLTTSQTFWEAFVTDPNCRKASWVSNALVFF